MRSPDNSVSCLSALQKVRSGTGGGDQDIVVIVKVLDLVAGCPEALKLSNGEHRASIDAFHWFPVTRLHRCTDYSSLSWQGHWFLDQGTGVLKDIR